MCRAGYGIFRDALDGGEVTADEVVTFVAWRGDDYSGTVHAGNCRHVRREGTQKLRAFQHGHIVKRVAENFDGNGAERFSQPGWTPNRFGWPGREIHNIALICVCIGISISISIRAMHLQRTACGMEDKLAAPWLESLHDDCGAGQGCMAAERYLDKRRKPAQAIIVASALAD